MQRKTTDVRLIVGRKVYDAAERFQDLLWEVRRLHRLAASPEQEREMRNRLFLILGLLNAHGPREDRLLRYQLAEMGEHLRRTAGARLAA